MIEDFDQSKMSLVQAFDAMRSFLENYWIRGGKTSDDLAVLLGNLNRGIDDNDRPLDQAQWSDWLEACQAVLTKNV